MEAEPGCSSGRSENLGYFGRYGKISPLEGVFICCCSRWGLTATPCARLANIHSPIILMHWGLKPTICNNKRESIGWEE